ncbi:lantibiotic dehydratase [Kitasatospora sp. RB6PN24]|uniref:lantibiotic dehydratase n=1 Tax=Kitasatospora humi TaxID=2893891 RepID=UPI001E5AA046|nr:lantibiotic dehydratase [Kitasatospora humi]MCC9306485.1 lantibiotic dehydratase [Kitasatospora humi]
MGTSHRARQGTLFTATGPVLLRAPALPRSHRRTVPAGAADPQGDSAAGLLAHLAEAAADPVLREAIEVSSPSLADVLDQVAAGAAPRAAALRRAAEAVSRYRLRMATRPTPFGLLAAVATARFDTAAKVRWSGAYRRALRPDLGWLLPLLDRLRTDPTVLPRLRLVLDQQAVLRGDRLVLPYLPEHGPAAGAGQPIAERTVRATAVVRAAMRAATVPIPHGELLAALAAEFPSAPAEAIAALVRTLVHQGFLHTDLTPGQSCRDLLGHVLERLPEDHSIRSELADIRDRLAHAAAVGRGQGGELIRAARARMIRLAPADRPIHAHLALDAEVTLPEQVRTEMEQAATVLWRLSPPTTAPEHLRTYHTEFVERYGLDSPVPLAELLDTDTGLGPPAGYRRPVGGRGAANPQPARARTEADKARDRLLAELAAGALADRGADGLLPEVLLDDELLDRLTAGDPVDGAALTPPAELELYAELAADSVEALDAGEFRLVLSPTAGSDRAGATFGRFAGLLADQAGPDQAGPNQAGPGVDVRGGDGCDAGGALLARAAGDGDGDGEVVEAHLEFTPYRPRHANIALTPRWLDHRVVVSAFPDAGGPAVLPLDDLVVVAHLERLAVHSRSLGREVRATARHALNLRTGAPNVARFLQEVQLTGQRLWQAWDWGAAGSAPALPRVRRGRVVLSPASWRLTTPVPAASAPFEQWAEGLARWRRRWGVPAAVRLVSGDQRISLDLELPWHQRLLHSQARSDGPTVLQEELAPVGDGGWLCGPDGAHTVELVVPLRRRATPRTTPRPRRALPARHPRSIELPGGPWLFARLAAAETRHEEILVEQLPRLLDALPDEVDRWFFIRYQDPAPHLRLRFHGAPPALATGLLPALHDWAVELRRTGLAADLRLESYAPETDRYGGPELQADAERVFHADSLVALAALRLARAQRGLSRDLLAAVNTAGIARDFLRGAVDGAPVGAWLAAAYPKSEQHHQAFRAQRAAALAAIGPDGPSVPVGGLLPADPALAGAWQQRAAALAGYAARLDRSWADPVLASLLHMSHNRLVGIDREAERRAHALARGAVEAHRARRSSR